MSTGSFPDPVAILLDEHRVAAGRIELFEGALAGAAGGDPATVRDALETTRETLAFLDRDLDVHIRKEEEPFFPLLKAALPADDRLIDEMVAEHDQVRLKREDLRAVLEDVLSGHDHVELREERDALRDAVAAVEAGTPSAAALEALGRAGRAVLRTLRVHFQNEEEIVFPLAPELLSADELASAGHAMIAIDREVAAMTQQPDSRTRPPGETTGSPQRPAQRVAAPVLTFDVQAEVEQLRREPAWLRGDRNAKTLVKEPDFRVVLTAMKAGARLVQHETGAPLTIQALAGRLRVHLSNEVVELAAGQLLALDRGVSHDVEALEESAFLLTIAWPGGTDE